MVTRVVSWAERTIWWHVYPLGFTGAEQAALAPGEPVRHRLRQLAGWLDYAVELGCSGRPAFPASPAELLPAGWPVYRLHQRLIGFRRRHPWLVRARTSVQHLTNEAIAFRAAADDAGILVLLNAGDTSFRFPVDVAVFAVAETPDPGARPADPALVPGRSWAILSS